MFIKINVLFFSQSVIVLALLTYFYFNFYKNTFIVLFDVIHKYKFITFYSYD